METTQATAQQDSITTMIPARVPTPCGVCGVDCAEEHSWACAIDCMDPHADQCDVPGCGRWLCFDHVSIEAQPWDLLACDGVDVRFSSARG